MSVVTSIHGVELGTRAGLTFSGHGADAEQRDLTAPTAAHCSRTAHRTHTAPETRLSSRHDRNDVVTLLDTVNLARAIPMMSSMPMSGGTTGSQPSEQESPCGFIPLSSGLSSLEFRTHHDYLRSAITEPVRLGGLVVAVLPKNAGKLLS
jgi:hypothetical protein